MASHQGNIAGPTLHRHFQSPEEINETELHQTAVASSPLESREYPKRAGAAMNGAFRYRKATPP
jgi:hypothetical protein